MNRLHQTPCRKRWIAWTAILTVSLAGCGPSAPRTYPVKGKLVLKGGDIKQLKGGAVEFVLKDDPMNVRAAGAIEEDGTFSLRTYQRDGSKLKGTVPGDYQVLVYRPGSAAPYWSSDATTPHMVEQGDNEFTIQVPKPR